MWKNACWNTCRASVEMNGAPMLAGKLCTHEPVLRTLGALGGQRLAVRKPVQVPARQSILPFGRQAQLLPTVRT
jgi:hypothetical protein